MNYVITFQNVMAAFIAIGGSIFIFFVKKWFADMEKKDLELLVKLESGNKDIKDRIEKNDAKTNERIDRLEEKTIRDIEGIKQEINDIKGDFATTFVLREDFFRSMNAVEDKVKSIDSKIDRLLLREGK
jgi:hypothetical protein|nr:MAG TPA: Protein of unknown function (DUF1664) [Caudoviricetes sp.]